MANEARLKVLKTTLLFDDMFVVPRVNRDGGLVLFWKKSIKASVKTSKKIILTRLLEKGLKVHGGSQGFMGNQLLI